MHNIKFNKYDINYPANWSEISKEQLLFISQLYAANMEKERFNTLVLQFLTGIPWKDFFDIPIECMLDLAKTVEWLHKPCELTKNHFPELEINKTNFYGPEDQFLSLSFEQYFGHTEPAFTNYLKTQDIEWLDYLVASLFTKQKNNFIADDIEAIKNQMPEVKLAYKMAIFLFYTGCRDLLINKFPALFKKKKASGKANDMYYFEMIDNLNNENIANNELIKKSNVWETFQRFDNMLKKAEKLESLKNRKK